jgi:hypothetical protein
MKRPEIGTIVVWGRFAQRRGEPRIPPGHIADGEETKAWLRGWDMENDPINKKVTA